MAAKKEDNKSEINYVGYQNFMKENYNKVSFVQRVQWPYEWGYIVPIYNVMYDTLAQGNQTPLPENILRVRRDTFADVESTLEARRPLPPTYMKLHGWKVGNSIVGPVDRWIEPRPYISMYKTLGWHFDSQH